MSKDQLRELIAQNRLKETIDTLMALTRNTRLFDEVIHQSSRFAQYEKLIIQGTEETDTLEQRRDKISIALLHLVDQLPEDIGSSSSPIPAPGTGTTTGSNSSFNPGNGGGTGDGGLPAGSFGTGDGGQSSRMPFAFSIIAFGTLLALTLLIPGWAQQNNALFKTLLALAAAGVAATLPGFLNFEINNAVKAGGALAAFALVFLVNPAKEEEPLTLTVFVVGKNGQSVKSLHQQGYVIMDVNGERKKELIDDKGQAHFKNLRLGDQARRMDIEFSEPFQPVRPDSVYILNSLGQLYLEVAMQHLGRIYGTVITGDLPLQDVLVSVDELKDTTDITGSFSITVPDNMQRTDPEVKFFKPGYKLLIKKAYPQTDRPLNVVMENMK
ncbi:MAG: hypothetical protein KIPDCIKN_00465 [Haliscomenobacter sp.]|jgi:hypothetical protein|nr:hypothetical protein [Haliscomenobacter sp.]